MFDDNDEGGLEPLDPMLLAETLAALSDRLSAQEDLLAALVDRLNQDQPTGGPWTWRSLSASQQQSLMTELRGWVDWLVERYGFAPPGNKSHAAGRNTRSPWKSSLH